MAAGGVEHLTLEFIRFLRCLQALRQPADVLTVAAEVGGPASRAVVAGAMLHYHFNQAVDAREITKGKTL